MDKLRLSPLQDAYSVEGEQESHRVELEGGLGRYRRDVLSANQKVSVRWSLSPNEYIYLNAFYRIRTKHGSEPFKIDLVLNSAVKKEYEAFFIPLSLRLDAIEDGNYKCSATLEVKSITAP